MKAAEILTSSVGGDKEKIVSSLLFSLSAIKTKKPFTEPIRESPHKFKSRDAENNKFEHERLKSNENKNRISEFKSYENKRGTVDMAMKRDSSTRRLRRTDQIQNKPEEQSITRQLLQKREQKEEEQSISKLLLQRGASATEEAQKKSRTQTRSPTPSISKQLLKEQGKQSFTSKTVPQKKPLEPSIIRQLQEQQFTSNTSLQMKSEPLSVLKELLKESREQKSEPLTSLEEHQTQEVKPSVIKTLLKNYQEQRELRQETQRRQERQERQEMTLQEPSISKMMLSQSKPSRSRFRHRKPKRNYMKREAGISPLHWILFDDDVGEEKRDQEDMSTYFKIFDGTNTTPSRTVELDTWNLCEEKYMKMITTHYPANAFQEMAQWTEEGKMWNFPIDNEQGMVEEHGVHFSEHVFLERHLVGWCPTKGPIRHFMELVCIGLSKNPYMTVQEKHDTIMWYREFFADKNDLLKKLGLSEIGQNVEKQAQLAQ